MNYYFNYDGTKINDNVRSLQKDLNPKHQVLIQINILIFDAKFSISVKELNIDTLNDLNLSISPDKILIKTFKNFK